MQVYNNQPAFSVWKNYTFNLTHLKKSMARLSSGLRIQTAADDPAGLAISERLRTQYRNTSSAAGNVENALNYFQTSDGWLQEIQNLLSRMSELAISANDSTKSATDRQNLQDEFRQMQQEIERITSGATAAGKYNGLYLFRGRTGIPSWIGDDVVAGSLYIQVGPDSAQQFLVPSLDLSVKYSGLIGSVHEYTYDSINMSLVASNHFSVLWYSVIMDFSYLSISVQSSAQYAMELVPVASDYISRKRAVMGAQMSRLNQTLEGLRTYEENIRAAESRIRDTDVARETTEFTKYQVLTQIGTAMLAQANTLPSSVMSLLAA